MQQYIESVQTTRNGVVVPLQSPSVTVYLRNSQTLASLFSDDGTTPKDNPFVATDLGLVAFYAANGRYDLVITKAGIVPILLRDILLDDATGGGTPGPVTASDIVDSSSVGRAVVTGDAAAGRAALSVPSAATLAATTGAGAIGADDGNSGASWTSLAGVCGQKLFLRPGRRQWGSFTGAPAP